MLYSIISFFFQYFYCHVGIVATFSSIFKFLYLPVTLLYFQNYEWKVEKKKIFSIILATYLGIYLFSYLLGIGQDVYLEAEGKSGFKGLFSSINEFSAIVVCLLPIVTTYLRKQKKIFLAILFLLMAFLSSLLIGTKVLMGGVIFSVFYF